MRLISRRTGLSDIKKIAVLTALKLATNQHKLETEIADYTTACKDLIDIVNDSL